MQSTNTGKVRTNIPTAFSEPERSLPISVIGNTYDDRPVNLDSVYPKAMAKNTPGVVPSGMSPGLTPSFRRTHPGVPSPS